MLAIIAPDILCHTLNIAPGTVAIAKFGKAFVAKLEARPEFYIPTSIAIVFLWRKFSPKSFTIV